ncbi:MAG: hypothetical protein ACK53W_12550 [Gemmatimonadota bacterium]
MTGFLSKLADRFRAVRQPAPARPSPDEVIIPKAAAPAPAAPPIRPPATPSTPAGKPLPRGIRNHNPGNIREAVGDTTAWVGERTTNDDPAFEEFQTPEDGVRALMVVLLTYYRRHRLDCVEAIISRWAPPNENETVGYVDFVCTQIGAAPRATIDLTNRMTLVALARAIVVKENGWAPSGFPPHWYPDEVYLRAADRALGREG